MSPSPYAHHRTAPVAAAAGIASIAALLLGACHDPVAITDGSSRTISAQVGAEVDVTLQTIGPGEFASPPVVSSGSVRFVEVSYLAPVPAGPTQRFRFQAVARGRAVITVRHTVQTRVVEDTVDVH